MVLEYEAPYLKIGMEISGIFVGIALCMVLISVMKIQFIGKNQGRTEHMIFQSYIFLFVFFPVLFMIYYILIKREKRNWADIFLSAMSILFYAYGNVKLVYFLIFEVILNYCIYRFISISTKRQA